MIEHNDQRNLFTIFEDTMEAVDKLKQQGYTVCAVEQAEGSTMLDNLLLDKNKKYAVIMGNEVKGVQQCVVDNCDMYLQNTPNRQFLPLQKPSYESRHEADKP